MKKILILSLLILTNFTYCYITVPKDEGMSTDEQALAYAMTQAPAITYTSVPTTITTAGEKIVIKITPSAIGTTSEMTFKLVLSGETNFSNGLTAATATVTPGAEQDLSITIPSTVVTGQLYYLMASNGGIYSKPFYILSETPISITANGDSISGTLTSSDTKNFYRFNHATDNLLWAVYQVASFDASTALRNYDGSRGTSADTNNTSGVGVEQQGVTGITSGSFNYSGYSAYIEAINYNNASSGTYKVALIDDNLNPDNKTTGNGYCSRATTASICLGFSADFSTNTVKTNACSNGGTVTDTNSCPTTNLVGRCSYFINQGMVTDYYYSSGNSPYTADTAKTACGGGIFTKV